MNNTHTTAINTVATGATSATNHITTPSARIDTTNMEASHTPGAEKTATTNFTARASANVTPKASLQGLPAELRNKIHEYVAETEDRFVLGWRFVKPRQNRSSIEHFHSAIALHPLGFTCHQIRNEFAGLHLAAIEPRWVLVVNNFELDQIEEFGRILDGVGIDQLTETEFQNPGYFKVVDWESHDGHTFDTPVYSPVIALRFHMDSDAVISADKLCSEVFQMYGEAPMPLCQNYYLDWKGGAFGIAEIVTTPSPYHAAGGNLAKGMTVRQAVCVEELFNELRSDVEEIFKDSYEYMEECWFRPFHKAVAVMRDAEGIKR